MKIMGIEEESDFILAFDKNSVNCGHVLLIFVYLLVFCVLLNVGFVSVMLLLFHCIRMDFLHPLRNGEIFLKT